MSSTVGTDDYREGALARLEDASKLMSCGRWTGAIYLAGRAVEAILRSLVLLRTSRLETGHDLRDLAAHIRELGLVHRDDYELTDRINEVAIVWHNNLRFVDERRLTGDLIKIGRHKVVNGRRVQGNVIKANALGILEACEAVVSRGDLIWKRYRTSSTKS